jgi:hypothetical protein
VATTSAAFVIPSAAIQLNHAALPGLVCSDVTLATCKQVGAMSLSSPLFSSPLLGTAYVTGTATSPTLIVVFPAPVAFKLTGIINDGSSSLTFLSMPDLPLTSLELGFTGGSTALFASNCASATGTVAGSFKGQDGRTATSNASLKVDGCPAGGGGGGGGGGGAGKPSESGASLSGLAKGKARLSFRLSAGSQAPKLKSFAISLPGGLSIAKSFIKGLAIHGGGKYTATLSHGRLTISLKTAATSIGVVLNNKALTVSKTLAGQVAKHKVKTLRFTTRVTDANGKTTTITLTLTVS